MQITNPLATIRPCTIKTFTMPFFKIGIKVMISMVIGAGDNHGDHYYIGHPDEQGDQQD